MADILLRPTTTNCRHQDHDCVYHIYNRVAHSVRFLGDEEKDDLMDRIVRISEFSGIRLLAWCLMTNHFHLLVYLPEPTELSADEIRRRLRLLRPEERAVFVDGFTLGRAPRGITERMFNIGMMMKIVKENFTVAYNGRTGHHGTMWEGPYRFKKIPMGTLDMMTVASYQNLNPIRACMAADYADYAWTSFAAAAKGDVRALEGIDFMIGGYERRTDLSDGSVLPAEELLARMREKMDRDLEAHQRERAEAVWRRRMTGGEPHPDPLVSEAMVEQVEAQMARLQSGEFHAALSRLLGRAAKRDEVSVIRAIAADPETKTADLAKVAGTSESRVKRISLILQKIGILSREGTRRRSVWRLSLPTRSAA